MSKIIVPLHFAKLTTTPGNVEIGFKKFYLKGEWFKLFNGASEIDVVLDRPLDNYIPIPGTITSSDTVLTAIEKLDYAIGNISLNVLWGNITGNILLQTDLIAYIASLPASTLQQVTTAGAITTDSITVAGITSGNLYSDGFSFGISDNFDVNYNLFYLPYVGLQITNSFEFVYINQDASIAFQTPLGYAGLRSDLLTGVRTLQLPDASGTLALTSNIGTWGALNYPTWVSGTPFVKMTAAGTFALDTNTYVTTANATLQNAYNNSTDGKILLDFTRGSFKVQAITGTTRIIVYHRTS